MKLIIFLLVFSQTGRSCSLIQYDYCKLGLGKKCEIGSARHLHDPGHELPSFKRKYKTKAIQVIVPHITRLTFKQYHKHSEFHIPEVESSGHYFVYYVQGKRGPPVV